MIFIIYALLTFIVIYFSIKCAYYLDVLESSTNLSGTFLSGVILAAITSLPELVTSVSAISFLDNPGLVLGNILGSNIFNFSILAFLILCFFKNFITNKLDPVHNRTLYFLTIIYVLILIKMQFNLNLTIISVDIVSLIMLILYLFSLKHISTIDFSESLDNNKSVITNNKNIKTLLIKFIIASIFLVIASVSITITTDKISDITNIGNTMSGAIFLGIATSIPEFATCITLCKLGNFNSAFGNMVGSNIFNFIIITIGDFLYTKGSIYAINKDSFKLTIFGTVSTILTLIILKSKNSNKQDSKLVYIISALLILLSYFLFIFL